MLRDKLVGLQYLAALLSNFNRETSFLVVILQRFECFVSRYLLILLKAPAKLYSLQGRYATALFNAASKSNKLKEVESEITKIKSFIGKNAEISSFLENPAIAREAKKSMVESMFAKQKYSDLTVNLFRAMAEYGRLDNTMKVIASFEQLMKEYNSVMAVKIISNQVIRFKSRPTELTLLATFNWYSVQTGRFSSKEIRCRWKETSYNLGSKNAYHFYNIYIKIYY